MGARVQHSPRYRRLCELLRGWREGAGLSQRALAVRLGKPPSFVHKCEVADRRIDPLELLDWCDACRVKGVDALRQLDRVR